MSWIFGFLGQMISLVERKRLSTIHFEPLQKVEKNGIYLTAGGIKETCSFGSFSPESGWVAVGLGIKSDFDGIRVLSVDDWQSILSNDKVDLRELDGHFVVLKWQSEQIEFFTDSVGLRTIYFAETDGGVAFSTRLDWIAQLTGRNEIDFETFGSHWLTFNQISYNCLLKGIKRLGPNGYAICRANSISLKDKPWGPRDSISLTRWWDVESNIRSFLKPDLSGINPNLTLSLGLSGGLDSRVLLTLLLSRRGLLPASPEDNFSLHLFSDPLDPDVKIAKRIAEENKLAMFHFYEPLPQVDEALKILAEYIGQTAGIETASKLLNLRYYSRIRSQNKFVIDGGFGEVWRRQYLNRLRLRGRKGLISGNFNLIFRYLLRPRAEIFTKEVMRVMLLGIKKELSSFWETMPSIEEIGEENFLDLMAIRTRLPNIGCYEQARLDGEVLNYMPFAQPSCLQGLFEIPLHWRRNGRLFKRVIRKNRPDLARYPLVKNRATYPFYLSGTLAWIWTKIKSQFDPSVIQLLFALKEFIQDIVHSHDVKSYAPYDYPAIVHLVSEFYAGRKELAPEVDWWLTFELWRQTIEKKI